MVEMGTICATGPQVTTTQPKHRKPRRSPRSKLQTAPALRPTIANRTRSTVPVGAMNDLIGVAAVQAHRGDQVLGIASNPIHSRIEGGGAVLIVAVLRSPQPRRTCAHSSARAKSRLQSPQSRGRSGAGAPAWPDWNPVHIQVREHDQRWNRHPERAGQNGNPSRAPASSIRGLRS